MEQVAEDGDEARRCRRVVVRSEDGAQRRVGFEARADPTERVRMHSDVGVHKDEDLAG